jgi:hypothetical protein
LPAALASGGGSGESTLNNCNRQTHARKHHVRAMQQMSNTSRATGARIRQATRSVHLLAKRQPAHLQLYVCFSQPVLQIATRWLLYCLALLLAGRAAALACRACRTSMQLLLCHSQRLMPC